MLNRILQTLLWGCTTIILITVLATALLTAEPALSSPLNSPLSSPPFSSPNPILIAEHSPDHHPATPVEPAPQAQPIPAAQPDESLPDESLPDDHPNARDRQPESPQANPSVPYDPYDYGAIREMNREIYGEAKGND